MKMKMKMKIALVSLPFTWNYGGILQHYALQKVLKERGYEVHILTIRKRRSNNIEQSLVAFKWKVIEALGAFGMFGYHKLIDVVNFKSNFMDNITTSFFTLDEAKQYIEANQIKKVVVGSDQIWNKEATHSIDVSFLNFTKPVNFKKYSYAPSFARDAVSYTFEEKKLIRKLLQELEVVSVRESSGVKILKESFECTGTHVLDPTLLLDFGAYEFNSDNVTPISGNYVFSYILDENEDKSKFVNYIGNSFNANVENFVKKKGYRGVESWIDGIKNSRFVVTDSFHGMCFAILFKKDFLVISNQSRGRDRFYSLLNLLNLENRIIEPCELSLFTFEQVIKINWDSVYESLNEQRKISFSVLDQI